MLALDIIESQIVLLILDDLSFDKLADISKIWSKVKLQKTINYDKIKIWSLFVKIKEGLEKNKSIKKN